MADAGGQEKTEQPTGKRIEDAREKGQVARSQEINSLAIFGTGLILIFMFQGYIGDKLSDLAVYIFNSLDTLELSQNILHLYVFKGFQYILVILAPILIGLVIISLAAGFGQTGIKLSPKALKFDAKKFDPIKGFKNKFLSAQPFVELTKSVFKVSLIGTFAYHELSDSILFSSKLLHFSIAEIVYYMTDTAFGFLWKFALIYIVLAAADFAWQKHKHKKDLMMTKQEVKEENKNTEGDPEVKGRIKGKQFEMSQKRMMQEVPKADVVITNPTHVAVALKYEMGGSGAPKVVAKGLDAVAQKIKEIAKENEIAMHEDVQLARALYKSCEIGDEIPEDLFKAVAQILAYVYNLKNSKKKTIV